VTIERSSGATRAGRHAILRTVNAGPSTSPRIDPVPPGAERPLWSVMIPAYNCADYLGETLQSVLAQDPGPERMEIVVLDDHSDDDPARVVAEVGAGRVEIVRNERNLGQGANLNACIGRARGELVHLLHGDDAVRPGFYAALEAPLVARPDLAAAFCRYVAIRPDSHWQNVGELEQPEAGVVDGWLEKIALGQRLQTPCIAVRRSTYEAIGGFLVDSDVLDWDMWVRVAAHGPVWYEPEPLALYRVRGGGVTDRMVTTGSNVRGIREVIERNHALLPPGRADAITAAALEDTALTALRRAKRLLYAGNTEALRSQVQEALRTSRSPRVIERVAELGLLWLRHRARLLLRRRA
jgi:glycosyltransferase involved in cell wall biosynthesis